jgi:hypothetical protein
MKLLFAIGRKKNAMVLGVNWSFHIIHWSLKDFFGDIGVFSKFLKQ